MALNGSGKGWGTGKGWPTGGGFSGGKPDKTDSGNGKRFNNEPVAEVPVQDAPEVDGINPDAVKTPADLARFFADSVRTQLGEFWEAPYWVRSWFADKVDWVFVAYLPDGPSWEIKATPQLWVKVIERFFEPTRRDPAIGKSGEKLWNEFRYWARNVDLLEERVVKVRRQELSAKTKVLVERSRVHGVEIDTEPERKARAAMFAAEEAVLDARAERQARKSLDKLQKALKKRQDELGDVLYERNEWLKAQGYPAEHLMEEHQARKKVIGLARANVRGDWEADRMDERIAEQRPFMKDPAARERARKARKRALEEYLDSDEGQRAVEAEAARLAEEWDRKAAERFAFLHPSEETIREVADWDEEDDPDPESGKHLMESLDIEGTAARLKAKLEESIKTLEQQMNEERE